MNVQVDKARHKIFALKVDGFGSFGDGYARSDGGDFAVLHDDGCVFQNVIRGVFRDNVCVYESIVLHKKPHFLF